MTTKAADSLISEMEVFFKRRNEGLTLLAQSTLTGSVASVTFSSIPQGFRTLFFAGNLRSDAAAEIDVALMRFNADSGNNYDYSALAGNAATPVAAVTRAASSMIIANTEAANSRASNFAPAFALFFAYASTAMEKWAIGLSGNYGNVSADADMFTDFRMGRWRSTAAVASINILPNTGANWVSGSIFQLYGVL